MRVSLHSNAGCMAKGVVLECDATGAAADWRIARLGPRDASGPGADTREQMQAIIARLREAWRI